MDILVTAFTPFGGMERNMSSAVMGLLPDELGKNRLHKLLIPTSYTRGFDELRRYLRARRTDAVVITGQAPREKLTIERLAVNVGDCPMADNDGVVYMNKILVSDAPAAYFSTLPVEKMSGAADCRISNSAGTYVCNAVLFKTLHFLRESGLKCGFVHVPQTGEPQAWADGLAKMIGALE